MPKVLSNMTLGQCISNLIIAFIVCLILLVIKDLDIEQTVTDLL